MTGVGAAVETGEMLHVEGLRKSYGEVEALRGVDLDVGAGEIVALIGPNGAGKTSLVSIVAGLRRADGGTVEVDGLDALRHSARVRRLIGLAPQDTGLYPVVSVRHNLQLFGELSGLTARDAKARSAEVAEALGLADLLDRQAGKLSGGQKRRLHTALALLHHPKLLLLDEATTGADVETRGQLLDLVRALAEDGSAIVYSTHYLGEVESLGGRIVIVDHGRVIARGVVDELIRSHAEPVIELSFHEGTLPELAGATRVDDTRLRLPAADPASVLSDVLPRLPQGALASVEIVRPTLEAVYLSLTGKRYDEADREGRAKVSGAA